MRSAPAALPVWALIAFLAGTPASVAEMASDPMRPDDLRVQSPAASPVFRVNAIIVSAERRIAIVNGRRVRVGDSVGDATVVAISKTEVVLDIDGDHQSLQVHNGAEQ